MFCSLLKGIFNPLNKVLCLASALTVISKIVFTGMSLR